VTETELPSTLTYDKWRYTIQSAADVNELMLVLAAYMSGWRAGEAARIPFHLAAPIGSPSELIMRAFELKQAELRFAGSSADAILLTELSLTISAAAARIRFLLASTKP
jgi:hypothetical protein